ncbi:MAG TPA: helix-turn-helix transcriptional regulator [Bryobacteraceae bacterium]|jgi:DNA-binding PadR family transcriptional regulator|nr:helix-turn-helix transcriptional regulator [Bryobacteraceae bacterium]
MSDPTLLVLSSLAEGDKHGYAMMQDIEAFAGVRLGPGTLYGAITRLEEHGWIRPSEARSRRQPYTITSSGRQHLQAELASLEQIVRAGLSRIKHA